MATNYSNQILTPTGQGLQQSWLLSSGFCAAQLLIAYPEEATKKYKCTKGEGKRERKKEISSILSQADRPGKGEERRSRKEIRLGWAWRGGWGWLKTLTDLQEVHFPTSDAQDSHSSWNHLSTTISLALRLCPNQCVQLPILSLLGRRQCWLKREEKDYQLRSGEQLDL